MAVCERDNRSFLFIATLSTCRLVGRAGRRPAWGSPGCLARGGRGRVPLLRPTVSAPYTLPDTLVAGLRVIPPHQVLAKMRSSRGS